MSAEPQEMIQVSTLVPAWLREKMKAKARKMDVGLMEYVRDLIMADIDLDIEQIKRVAFDAGAMPHRRKLSPPVIRQPEPVFPEVPTDNSVLGMAARGYTGNQIAAILRLPYREVMRQLGCGLDKQVELAERINGRAAA